MADPGNKTVRPGVLYVVATPIGNLQDITLRALDVLKSVDVIAAEDTRETGKLLAAHSVKTRMISCHEHNEAQRAEQLLNRLKAGGSAALVSDAGTPSISDPGYRMVSAAIEAGLDVIPIPGPSAAMTALSVSGLSTDAFAFIGFLPKKPGKRAEILKILSGDARTLIFYESPKRIISLLDEARQALGDRDAVACREMTKLHEEFLRGRLSDIQARLLERDAVKGEFTLLIAGREASAGDVVSKNDLAEAIQEALQEPGARVSSVAKAIARRFDLPKKQVYAAALEIQGQFAEKPHFS